MRENSPRLFKNSVLYSTWKKRLLICLIMSLLALTSYSLYRQLAEYHLIAQDAAQMGLDLSPKYNLIRLRLVAFALLLSFSVFIRSSKAFWVSFFAILLIVWEYTRWYRQSARFWGFLDDPELSHYFAGLAGGNWMDIAIITITLILLGIHLIDFVHGLKKKNELF